jgi:hypothetical protein
MGLVRGLFFLAVLVGGLAMINFGWSMYQNEQLDVQEAVEVEGTVKSTGVEEIGSPESSRSSVKYEPVVRYTYTFDDREYTSESVYPGPEKRFGLKEDARAVADQYTPGQTTTVYVNQQQPTRAFLIKETGGNLLPFFLMGFGAVLALTMVSSLGKEILGSRSDG